MKAVRWTFLLLIVLMGCQGEEQPQEAEIWKVLFDGETFTGWIGLGRDSVPGGHWIIEDGSIRKVASGTVPTAPDGQPLEGGDLMTVESYRDFELVFEWKVSPGANSGIKYNVSEAMSTASPPAYAALGFEYQVLDDDLHPDAQNGPNRMTESRSCPPRHLWSDFGTGTYSDSLPVPPPSRQPDLLAERGERHHPGAGRRVAMVLLAKVHLVE